VRTVMVTGAIGAIGSVLTQHLLEEEDTRLRLLLRAKSRAHLEERLQELYRFWRIDPNNRLVSARVEALIGDVTVPCLGLEDWDYQRLAAEVTHVIHSAGNVKLNRPLDEARRSALDSANHIVSFVDACGRNGQFQKLEFVSTVGVAGRMAGTVPERALTEPRSFRNSYEAAKAEAEAFVLREMERGLVATIHRPSMVVGRSEDGRIIQFQVFYYLCEFLSGQRTAGIIPDAHDIRLDIVPVDYVARAIQASSIDNVAAGRIFHLCAGPSEAPQINQLACRVRDFFATHGRRLPLLRPIPPVLMRALLPLVSRLATGDVRRSLKSLPYFLAYLGAPQTFANVRSEEFFSAVGLRVPPVETYLDAVLSYYLARQSGATVSAIGRASRVVSE
jgi:thioester reductase-like protein